jgi:catechol 2,3-dioxygenase-like lactoylglutathione lyase family enzyme/predicted enzyme related to lactoylglutathione lyase
MLKRALVCCGVALAVSQPPAFAQTGFVNMVDHIHLGVPDQAKGAEWYHTHFGGALTPEGPDRVMFGKTRMIFQKTPTPTPSEGSVLDLIGFSVANLDATMKELQAAGVTVVMPVTTIEGMKVAQVTDPWGTLIEVVQDPSALGLHHVCVLSPNPTASLAWFADKFGGTPTRYRGKVEGINYGGIWLLGKKGDAAPSAGHAIDHIGFRPVNVDAAVASFKTKNVKVTTEPRPLVLPSGTAMRLAFVEGPDGVRIELVQRDNLK